MIEYPYNVDKSFFMRFFTPLRYPGGKGKLAYYIKSIFEHNQLQGGHYAEPYAGGAAIALELLFHGIVEKIHINDIDPAVYSFWDSAVNNTDKLIELIEYTEINMDTWEQQKIILSNPNLYTKVELGFAAFFLNRTNRSGILKAGVIGGKKQSGEWKMDARFNKQPLIDRIKRISLHSDNINVYNLDAIDFLHHLEDRIPKNSLVYLDPPYYVKGQGLYRNFYVHDDHIAIKNALMESSHSNWIVSYDNAEQIREIYKGLNQKQYSLQYTAQQKTVGSEIMIFSDNISIPNTLLGKR